MTGWDNLTEIQKQQYKTYCDGKYGKTMVSCETGEPMYDDEYENLIKVEISKIKK